MSDDKKDHEFGFGKPPEATRWKKGQSGNPDGARRHRKPRRKKGIEALLDTLLVELERKIMITENGKRKQVSIIEVFVKQIIKGGVAANPAQQKILLGLLQAATGLRKPEEPDVLDQEDLDIADDLVARIRRGKKEG